MPKSRLKTHFLTALIWLLTLSIGRAEELPALIAKLSDRDPSVQSQAALAIAQTGVLDYSAVGALERLGNDFSADKQVRFDALYAVLMIHPDDPSNVESMLNVMEELDNDAARSRSYGALRKQGDAAVPAITNAYNSKKISYTYAKAALQSIGTTNSATEYKRIVSDAQGHVTTEGPATMSHYGAAPNVTRSGASIHEVK